MPKPLKRNRNYDGGAVVAEQGHSAVEDALDGSHEEAEERALDPGAREAEQFMEEHRREQYWNEPLEVLIFDTENDHSDVFVAVNGLNWLIQRGKWVTLPRKAIHVLENAVIETFRHEGVEDALTTRVVPHIVQRFPFTSRPVGDGLIADAEFRKAFEGRTTREIVESHHRALARIVELEKQLGHRKLAKSGEDE